MNKFDMHLLKWMVEAHKGGIVVGRVAYVDAWAAVKLEGHEQVWRRFGACSDDRIIPAGHRRRLGTFGRMAVACGLSLRHIDTSDVVFCSRYGDMDIACKLLLDLSVNGTLSPARFSMSVHNAAPAVMDLIRKNRVGHTAIAGGTQSLSAGVAEAWSRLQANPMGKVALVYAETALPADLAACEATDVTGRALALGLSLDASSASLAQLMLDESDVGGRRFESPDSEMLGDQLVAILEGDAAVSFSWRSRGLAWSFGAHSNAQD